MEIVEVEWSGMTVFLSWSCALRLAQACEAASQALDGKQPSASIFGDDQRRHLQDVFQWIKSDLQEAAIERKVVELPRPSQEEARQRSPYSVWFYRNQLQRLDELEEAHPAAADPSQSEEESPIGLFVKEAIRRYGEQGTFELLLSALEERATVDQFFAHWYRALSEDYGRRYGVEEEIPADVDEEES